MVQLSKESIPINLSYVCYSDRLKKAMVENQDNKLRWRERSILLIILLP